MCLRGEGKRGATHVLPFYKTESQMQVAGADVQSPRAEGPAGLLTQAPPEIIDPPIFTCCDPSYQPRDDSKGWKNKDQKLRKKEAKKAWPGEQPAAETYVLRDTWWKDPAGERGGAQKTSFPTNQVSAGNLKIEISVSSFAFNIQSGH